MDLIDDLKKEHVNIVRALDEVKKLGVGSVAGREKLLSAKDDLIGHLLKEDRLLYPVLKEEAKDNRDLKFTLDNFASDMEGISSSAIAFFEKYEGGDKDGTFAKDLGNLFAVLGGRIRKEEKFLYKEYEKIQDEAG